MSYFFEKELEAEINKSLEHFRASCHRLSLTSASPELVEAIVIDYQGFKMPLIQLASIRVADQRSLLIEPWDASGLKAIEQALSSADLGALIKPEARAIRVTLPPVTGEDRERLAKHLRTEKENARIVIRNLRDKVWREVQEQERAGQLTEDDKFKAKERLDKLVENTHKTIDELTDNKVKQVLKV